MNARHLLIGLGVAAVASIALAAIAVQERGAAPPTARGEFLPGFAAQVKNAARLHIVSQDGTFDVTYHADKGWVLPQQGDYPADFNEVRHTLIGLAALEIIEPKTARPDWFRYIGLDMPRSGSKSGGDGVELTVSDAQGHTLASLIMGHMQTLGDPNGAAGLFVRRPNENQSWLARAVFVPHGAPSDWMLLHVLDIDSARLKDITIAPSGAPSYTLSRARMSDAKFSLSPAVKNANPQILDAIANAVTGFTATDVRPAAQLDFSKSAHIIAHTFDGLAISLDAIQTGADVWVTISATTTPSAAPGMAREVEAVATRTANWAYKLSPDKGQLLTMKETMLAGPPAPAAPANMVPGP